MRLLGIGFFAVVFIAVLVSYPIVNSNFFDKDTTIESPLPEFLTKFFPSVLGNNTYWKPKESVISSNTASPAITAAAAISYDLITGSLIYQKNMKSKLPMASLTKVMTAIIALENMDIDKKLTVNTKAAQIGENSMGLTEGETYTLKELLYGLILHSGNDAAEVIAQGSRFGRENFIYLMNKKAEDLGLSDTRFTNPSGLEGDGKQYSTVYDLLVITKYALENPIFAKVVSTVEYEILYANEHKYIYLFNETNLLTSYSGVRGVKTGYTDEAGLCLVTYLEHEGHKIIAVLLNSQSRREEMKELLDYSLRTLGSKPPPHN
ncbi:MAG: D-alanyl-D-alanine carboxypeptidase [Candidatus Levybacteria bacterium]|nr:D-alanyl-D-alanine carboxypeptidase [Candidatus Levybacteria bacterium]